MNSLDIAELIDELDRSYSLETLRKVVRKFLLSVRDEKFLLEHEDDE